MKFNFKPNQQGLSMVELVVVMSIIGVFFVGVSGILIDSLHNLTKIEARSRAYFFAQDAIEAAKNIRDRNWDEIENLEIGTVYHPLRSGDEWTLVAGAETISNYTRGLVLADVLRDSEGNIVMEGGTADPLMRQVKVTVTWPDQDQEVVLANYLTHWQYSYNFVHYITQTNKSDFERSIVQNNVDVSSSPGNVLLARPELYYEDFETYGNNADPTSWVDTKKDFSLVEDQSLFKTKNDGDNSMIFGTVSEDSNIHSHYNGTGASNWKNYEVKGRMMFTNANQGGMGITFTSLYPTQDKYFYLTSEYTISSSTYFGIGSRNTSLTAEGVDDRSTDVAAEAGVWYFFRIQVKDVSNQSLIVAKVWKDIENEPSSWQIDCFSEESSRPITGTVGFWTEGRGEKYFDNIEVRDLTSYLTAGEMESAHFDTGAESIFGEIFWTQDNPTDTDLKLQLRSADSEAALSSAIWQGPTGTTDYYQSALGQEVINAVHRYDRWIQYKAYLASDNPQITPSLQEISISYDHRH